MRYRQSPLGAPQKVNAAGFPQHEPDKRPDRGQSQVARSWRVTAGHFQVFQESEHPVRVDGLKGQLVDGAVVAARKKSEEEAERVAITAARVKTESALTGQVLAKEALDQFREFSGWAGPAHGNDGSEPRRPAVRLDPR